MIPRMKTNYCILLCFLFEVAFKGPMTDPPL